ncbi:MAG TPA: hypothetical protein VK886_16265 [Vicinamibacterales bacterium]|nr:hypothetical protein [Vicinamibacterales bacterium]
MTFWKITLLVCAMFFLFLPSDLRAQQPPAEDCGSIADSGERLKCKHGKVLDGQGRLIQKLETDFAQFIPADSIERLKRAHGRATRAKDRLHSKHFKSLGKKSPDPDACKIKALATHDADGDGECDPGDQCEELIGDFVGDERQPCKMKGKSPEACVEVCEGDDTMEEDVDPQALEDAEENYDDVIESLAAANAVLEQNGPLMAFVAGSLLAADGPAAVCQASTDWLGVADALATRITKLASTWTRGLADLAQIACDQTVAGFNASVLCIPTEASAMALALIADTTEGVFTVLKVLADNSVQKCLSSLSGDLQGTKTTLDNLAATLGTVASTTSDSSNLLSEVEADVQNIQTTVDDLTANVNALRATVESLFEGMNKRFTNVETLLNTPPGQRPEFPKP